MKIISFWALLSRQKKYPKIFYIFYFNIDKTMALFINVSH